MVPSQKLHFFRSQDVPRAIPNELPVSASSGGEKGQVNTDPFQPAPAYQSHHYYPAHLPDVQMCPDGSVHGVDYFPVYKHNTYDYSHMQPQWSQPQGYFHIRVPAEGQGSQRPPKEGPGTGTTTTTPSSLHTSGSEQANREVDKLKSANADLRSRASVVYYEAVKMKSILLGCLHDMCRHIGSKRPIDIEDLLSQLEDLLVFPGMESKEEYVPLPLPLHPLEATKAEMSLESYIFQADRLPPTMDIFMREISRYCRQINAMLEDLKTPSSANLMWASSSLECPTCAQRAMSMEVDPPNTPPATRHKELEQH